MEDFEYKPEWLEGINLLNDLQGYFIFRIVYETLAKMKNKVDESFQEIKLNVNAEKELKIRQSIYLLLRYIVKKGDKVDEAIINKFLNENTNLGEEQIGEIAKALNSLNQETVDSVLKLGRLISFNWSVKNNINTKDIDNVNRLFVELDFSVKKADLSIANHSITLSLPEFKKFLHDVREMKNSMENFA